MAKRKKFKNNIAIPLTLIIAICFVTFFPQLENLTTDRGAEKVYNNYDVGNIPDYEGKPYIILNDNEPYFSLSDYSSDSFEEYSDLDSLGRVGIAVANIGLDLMPTEERGSIGMIKPTGWHTVKYDFVDGKYLYNRCHLIAYQLTGENANEKNLMTCTRSMNTGAMLEFENKVADYIKKSSSHVLYRVTPIFIGEELLARGVEIEAKSIEDDGAGIKFNVFIYNVEEGVTIDYATGESQNTKKVN